MKNVICVIAMAALAAGCGKKKDEPAKDEAAGGAAGGAAGAGGAEATKPAEAGGAKEIPNLSGLVAEVPPNAVPNAMGGAAGFHAADESFMLLINETSPEEAAKDLETMKSDSASVGGFKKWVKEEPTADGWNLVWESGKFELAGEEMKEVGTQYSYQVRRKIGDKTYTCYGGVPTAEAAETGIKACQSVKAK